MSPKEKKLPGEFDGVEVVTVTDCTKILTSE
jgi:hypothetical protein